MNLPLIPSPAELQPKIGFYSGTGNIEEQKDTGISGEEQYRLEISKSGILLRASHEKGFFYGRQTLRQLEGVFGKRLPCCVIDDRPAFSHRGFMIDCVRHFFPVADLKAMIEAAALFKFNIFHWHLVDDQGWRVPIDRYPRLTQIGSKRSCSNFGRYMEPAPYGGVYSKEDIREIVRFCAQRHIDVIPEIEMPGHVSALLAAYPEFSCTKAPIEVKTRGGIHKDILCAGNEAVYEVMENILTEVMELFPYHKIHIGGDEAPKDNWAACPACQKKIKQEGLKNESELQCYFTNRIAAFLGRHGRTAIVWNDALKGGSLDPSVEVQYWIGELSLTEQFVNSGGHMIMSDYYHYYLDYSYGQTSLAKIHTYDPIPAGLTHEAKSRFDGVEAPIWTEYIPDLRQMGRMVWPRMAAVAQTGWSREILTPLEFESRAEQLMPLLHTLGIPSAPKKLWNMKKNDRIRDALKFWYHAMTWGDFKAFICQLKREKKEAEENARPCEAAQEQGEHL